MQLARWKLTRGSRIVIIVLILHLLGVGQLAFVSPAWGGGADPSLSAGDAGCHPVDSDLPPAVTLPGACTRGAGSSSLSPDVRPPAAVRIARWLPRAPPAV